MPKELRLEDISQELVQKAIRTLPVSPEYAEIYMVASGIALPKNEEERGEERYLRECSENHVIPFSNTGIRYNTRREAFVPFLSGDLISICADPCKLHSPKGLCVN